MTLSSHAASNGSKTASKSPFQDIFRKHMGLLKIVMLFSAGINILALGVSLYTMQIYDRVLTSQSRDTLIFLTLAVILALLLSSALEGVRQMIANRVGAWFAQQMAPPLLMRSLEQRITMPNVRLEALREMAIVKNFLSTPTIFSLLDMLWVPVYLLVVFLLHPLFGVVALIGAALLFALTYYNERVTRAAIKESQVLANRNMQYAESLVRNSEVIDAMGMANQTVANWSAGYREELRSVDVTQNFSSKVLALTKFIRNMIQIAIMGIGALLVLDIQLTAGAMIAGSIIVARLLAPIEQSISFWKQFVLARHSLTRLSQFCSIPRVRSSEMTLPEPHGDISVQGLTYIPPGLKAPVLRGVDLSIKRGAFLAIVGPSASGKTTLSRLIVGVLKPTMGHVRLDNADTFEWKRADFGRHVGYLPQDIELLPGTIRDNIARFRTDAKDEDVIAATKLADCHDMILQLENGYDMMLVDGGLQLSGGQRQRIGLARALFGMPKLIVLDEPNSSLDMRGDAALLSTLRKLKSLEVTTVVVSHRTNLLRLADKIVVMNEGRVANFGNAPDVIQQLTASAQSSQRRPASTRQPSPNTLPSVIPPAAAPAPAPEHVS